MKPYTMISGAQSLKILNPNLNHIINIAIVV